MRTEKEKENTCSKFISSKASNKEVDESFVKKRQSSYFWCSFSTVLLDGHRSPLMLPEEPGRHISHDDLTVAVYIYLSMPPARPAILGARRWFYYPIDLKCSYNLDHPLKNIHEIPFGAVCSVSVLCSPPPRLAVIVQVLANTLCFSTKRNVRRSSKLRCVEKD